jgi:hypothetical protein
MALELYLGVNTGGVSGGSEPLLIEHRPVVEPPQDEPAASLLEPLLDLARNVRGPRRADQSGLHNSMPSAKRSA